jgi:hypothetical protein
MNKKTVGMLAGAAVGAIAWRVSEDTDPLVIPIVVDADEQGAFRLTTKPLDRVHLRFRQRVVWKITNNSQYEVRVAVENWRNLSGGRVLPVAFADEQPGLWCVVPGNGGTNKIRGKGRLPRFLILPEDCEYDVYLNDQLIADPIVKLVL